MAHSFKNIAANGTTVAKAAPGNLISLTINTKGASANVVTIYDSLTASGTKIATIDSTVTYGTLLFNVTCAVGLTVVLGTGTAADVTVVYD